MSSINRNRNPQPSDPSGRPPLIRQPGRRGLNEHTAGSLGSSEPSVQEPLKFTAHKIREVVQDQFPSNISQGDGGGGKATPPSCPNDLREASLQLRSISLIDDGLDDVLGSDSGDESKAGSPQSRSTTRDANANANANAIVRISLSIFNSGDEEKPPTPSSKKGGGGGSKMGEQFTFPDIVKDEGEYAPSSFAFRGFDLEFQRKVKAALKDCYQSIDTIKTVFSQKEAAKDAEEDFQSRLANILRMDYDSSKKIEGLQPSQALKQEALNSVNNEILLNLVAKLVDNRDELSRIVKTILIECNYAVLGEEGVYLAAAKPQEFLIFSEAFNEAQKQLDICLDLFNAVSRELASKGCPEEGIQSRLSDFIKGFEFTPRKSLFTTAEIKQFINQILALDQTRREEAKEEARTTLISKGMNPKVIEYGIKQLFLTRYKDKFARVPSGSFLAFKVESFIKEEYMKIVFPLAKKFEDEGWNVDVALSTIHVVMENHIEKTSSILEKDGIEGLREFVDTTVQSEVRAILKDVLKYLTLRAMTLARECEKEGWDYQVALEIVESVMNEPSMSIQLKKTIKEGDSKGLNRMMKSEVKPQVMERLEKIPKVSPPDKKPKI